MLNLFHSIFPLHIIIHNYILFLPNRSPHSLHISPTSKKKRKRRKNHQSQMYKEIINGIHSLAPSSYTCIVVTFPLHTILWFNCCGMPRRALNLLYTNEHNKNLSEYRWGLYLRVCAVAFPRRQSSVSNETMKRKRSLNEIPLRIHARTHKHTQPLNWFRICFHTLIWV